MNANFDVIKRYSNVVREHPVLSKKEEFELFNILLKFKSGKTRQNSRDKIFNSNLSLVMKFAYQYGQKTSVDVEDLISAGNEGLGMAIDRFDHKRGNKFSTYAVPWILLHIFQTMKVMGHIVTIPAHIICKYRKYNEIIDRGISSAISDKELRKKMDVTEKVLHNIKAAKISSVSIDQNITNKNGSDDTSVANFIPDTKNISTREKILGEEQKHDMLNVINELTDIQKEVILSRYMSNENNKLGEIGARLHISGERVRQIEVKALRRMRLKMRQRGYLKLD